MFMSQIINYFEILVKYVTLPVREYQLWLCEYMSCLPGLHHTYQVVSVWDNPELKRPRGPPKIS